MNSRAFLWVLVLLIIAFIVGWFFFVYPRPSPTPSVSTSTATTSEPATTEPAAPTPTLDPATVAANIAGNWVSTDDSNYTVQITSSGPNGVPLGGKWSDTYKGSDKTGASLTGTYTLFTSAAPDKDFTGVLVPGVVYLKVVEGQSTLYYSVLTASNLELQISYLDRGNTLSFVKVQ